MSGPNGTFRVLHVDDDLEFARLATAFLKFGDGTISVTAESEA